MRTYIVDGITIQTSTEVVAVRVGGHLVTLEEKRGKLTRTLFVSGQNIKLAAKEYWRNNYFRRHTKTYLSMKAAEIISRSIGIHTLYLIAREHLFPHLPDIYDFLTSINWPEMFIRFDLGFLLGIITTLLIRHFKRSVINGRSERV